MFDISWSYSLSRARHNDDNDVFKEDIFISICSMSVGWLRGLYLSRVSSGPPGSLVLTQIFFDGWCPAFSLLLTDAGSWSSVSSDSECRRLGQQHRHSLFQNINHPLQMDDCEMKTLFIIADIREKFVSEIYLLFDSRSKAVRDLLHWKCDFFLVNHK